MKYILLITFLTISTSCAPVNDKRDKDYGSMHWSIIRQWDAEHWKGQDFKATVKPEMAVMNQSVDLSQSMFAQSIDVSPTEFIENLKQSDIIKRVYNPEIGFLFDRRPTEDVVIELGPNFYTLSHADQTIITDMIARAFQRNHYALTDWQTKKVIGQITPDGFYLF